MATDAGDHLGLVGRAALAQGICLDVRVEQLIRIQSSSQAAGTVNIPACVGARAPIAGVLLLIVRAKN
jgi:hypothetical protein